jgi:uncharacterized protein YoaH (UPF0181 family)
MRQAQKAVFSEKFALVMAQGCSGGVHVGLFAVEDRRHCRNEKVSYNTSTVRS